MLGKKEKKTSKGRGIKTNFKEVRDNLGRLLPRLGNVTFSIAPEENLEALDVVLNADGSPSKKPITSPENNEKIISHIQREEKAIRFHAVSRIDIMLHILIAYYGTKRNVGVKPTEMQHGVCTGTKTKARTFFEACHSSIFPNLFDYTDLIDPFRMASNQYFTWNAFL